MSSGFRWPNKPDGTLWLDFRAAGRELRLKGTGVEGWNIPGAVHLVCVPRGCFLQELAICCYTHVTYYSVYDNIYIYIYACAYVRIVDVHAYDIHIYTYTYMYMHMPLPIHMHMYTVHVHVYAYLYAYAYVFGSRCMCIWICMSVCVWLYTCVHLYMYMSLYKHVDICGFVSACIDLLVDCFVFCPVFLHECECVLFWPGRCQQKPVIGKQLDKHKSDSRAGGGTEAISHVDEMVTAPTIRDTLCSDSGPGITSAGQNNP